MINGVSVWRLVNPHLLLDILFASALGSLLLSRVNEARNLWLLRGYLFLVALAWLVQRYANLPLTSKLTDALVLACSLSLAILWQGELRRLMELLGTGRLAVLFVQLAAETARLSQHGCPANRSCWTPLSEPSRCARRC